MEEPLLMKLERFIKVKMGQRFEWKAQINPVTGLYDALAVIDNKEKKIEISVFNENVNLVNWVRVRV